MTLTITANAAELVRNACVVQASRHEMLSQRGLHLRALGGVSKKKNEKSLRSEINEAVKFECSCIC